MTLNIVDVSRYQAGVDFTELKRAGCNAVIVGCTFGTAGINPAALAQLDGVKAAGMLRGAYHIRARQNTTPEEEVDFFLAHVGQYFDGSTLPVLDWEECDLSDEAWALTWLQYFERRTGIKPWFYASLDAFTTYHYYTIAAAGYADWLAYYPYATVAGFQGSVWTAHSLPAGHTMAAWQYASGGIVGGYEGLDLSVAYMDAKGWAAYAAPHVTAQSGTTTPLGVLSMADINTITAQLTTLKNGLDNMTQILVRGYTQDGNAFPSIAASAQQAAGILDAPVQRANVPGNTSLRSTLAYLDSNLEAVKAAAAAPAAAVTLTDAQVTAIADQLKAALGPATVAAIAAQWNK